MDTRIKLRELSKFIKALKTDYKTGNGPSKADKRKSYLNMSKLLFINIWNGITAPIIYPIWYLFRKRITNEIYANTSWEVINKMIDDNKTSAVKKMLKSRGKFLYWLWTYGDLRDPLGYGELTGSTKKNNFWNRFFENAIRNVRFTINFMEFRTANIKKVITVIDTRNFSIMHKSEGIGDSPDGVYFKWMLDTDNVWGFIYEDNNSQNIFYFGNTGLLKYDIGSNGRFECGYRKTDSSYTK